MTHKRKPAAIKIAAPPGATPKRKLRIKREEMNAVTTPMMIPMK
jgi:hypothetical protein